MTLKPHLLRSLTDQVAQMHHITGPRDLMITDLTADSRQVKPGMLFAAFPGDLADGRAYIPAALAAGACALLVPQGTVLPPMGPEIAVLQSAVPRRAFSLLAAAMYDHQQPHVVAVTGTNGKTSTASFVRQIWEHLGIQGASLGTLGLVAHTLTLNGKGTTPDPVTLHRLLAQVKEAGITHLCMEASSHGLNQSRLDGLILDAAAFTNITRDHMDYHHTFEAYFEAKCRLFNELLPHRKPAVLNADIAEYPALKALAEARQQPVISYGEQGEELRLERREPAMTGQRLHLRVFGQPMVVDLPLAGAFQVENALAAAGLVIAGGVDPRAAIEALAHLEGVPGRLEMVGTHNGASVVVDYAHTPDALETVISALRPHVSGKLVLVFGCGGDRDAGKRPQMGEIAARLADLAILTDDNPRSEDPAEIRRQVLVGCEGQQTARPVQNIGDRRHAIAAAIASLEAGDVLLIAGKGHESGQTIGARELPFDDRDEARSAITLAENPALWTAQAIAQATQGVIQGAGMDFACHGVSIDSRTVAHGDLFIAIQGPSHDGHDWVRAALEQGAAGALVHRVPQGLLGNHDLLSRVILVADTFDALQDLGRAGRARFQGRVVGVTGSVGKTSSKEMLALILAVLGKTHAAVGSFNNHWGVPLTLARTPADAAFAVIEMGMNHAGEIRTLTALARPHVAVITTIASAHIEHLGSLEAIADAKAEIFEGLEPGGTAVLPTDAPQAERLRATAQERGLACRFFGAAEGADLRLAAARVGRNQTEVEAVIDRAPLTYTIGAAGHHWAMNSLAVLAAVEALTRSRSAMERAAEVLATMRPPKGRGERHSVTLRPGTAPLTVIDEAYNANPDSMKAALASLPRAEAVAGRRIVALGDMLELGDTAADLHRSLAQAVTQAGVDLVFTAGPLSQHLYDALPVTLRGGHTADSAALAPLVAAAVAPGDLVMAKGSAGSRMVRVIDALLALEDVSPLSAGGIAAAATAKE